MRRFRFGELPREFVIALLAGLFVVLAFAAVASEGLTHGTLYPQLSQWVEVLGGLCGAAALATAARRATGRDRRAWALLTGTIVCWTLGTTVYAVRGLAFGRFEANHLYADVFYLCAVPLAFLGFRQFPTDRGPISGRLRPTLDALIVATSGAFVSWDVAFSTIVAHREQGLAGWLSLLYPATDLILCTFGVLIAARAPVERRISISLLAAAMFAFAISDSSGVTLQSLGLYHIGGLSDLGWLAGLLLGSLVCARLRLRRTSLSSGWGQPRPTPNGARPCCRTCWSAQPLPWAPATS